MQELDFTKVTAKARYSRIDYWLDLAKKENELIDIVPDFQLYYNLDNPTIIYDNGGAYFQGEDNARLILDRIAAHETVYESLKIDLAFLNKFYEVKQFLGIQSSFLNEIPVPNSKRVYLANQLIYVNYFMSESVVSSILDS